MLCICVLVTSNKKLREKNYIDIVFLKIIKLKKNEKFIETTERDEISRQIVFYVLV